MTRQEIEKKIEELETKKFYIMMIDRWTNEDREIYDRVTKEIRELKEKIK